MGVVICLVPPSPSPDAGERRVGAEGAVSGAGAAGAIRECPTRLHSAGLAGAGDTPAIMPSWRSRGWGHLTQIRRLQHSTFPQKFPGLPGPDWRSRVGGATGETAGRRKRIIRRDGASRSRGERAPRFSVPPLGPAPRCHSTSFLPRPASETARASEATSEITEPRPSEGTWLARGNPGTGISSLCLAFLCLLSLSRTHCHLPHLQDPVIRALTAVHFLWLGPRLHLAPIPLTASGVPFRAGNPTGGRETWLCLIWYTPSPGRVRTSKLDPALQNIPQA